MIIIRLVCLCLQVRGPQIRSDLLVHLFLASYLRRIKTLKTEGKKNLDSSSGRNCFERLLKKLQDSSSLLLLLQCVSLFLLKHNANKQCCVKALNRIINRINNAQGQAQEGRISHVALKSK